MSTSRLGQLREFGQSFWYDNIRRGLLVDGTIQRMIDEDGLRGMTSNPAIFQKAIADSGDYDDAIREMAEAGKTALEIYETLAVEDIQAAADLLRPVYDQSAGADGFISLEVSPKLADDTAATIAEAKRLASAVDRANLLIKVPGTAAGLPAITELLASGINVNVTLIFSVGQYARVAEAFIAGLERRAEAGRPLDRTASVASVFISRVDTLVDRLLDDTDDAERASLLKGRSAVAMAKLCYQCFKSAFDGEPFASLRAKGARVQPCLWASTSAKDPALPDTCYVDPLIGPDTINTMPQVTVDAFGDHGQAAVTIEEDVDQAEAAFRSLAKLGIDMEDVGRKLQDEGVTKFVEPFESLLASIEEKRRQFARS